MPMPPKSDARLGSFAPFWRSASHFRSPPRNGHRQTGPVDPVGPKSRLVSSLCLRLKYRSRFPRNLQNMGEASVINKTLALVLACMACLISNAADAAEIKILCASGMREVVSELQPQLARLVGQEVSISFGEAGDLRKRLQGGEIADVLILPRIVLDQVLADGNIVPGTTIDVAQSSIGIGVRKDGPKLDISSAEKFKQVLLAAHAIV